MDKAPDAFRTISEVADELDLPQHVLRFWETRFNQIRPMKRGGGRRFYRPEDVDLLRGIRHLLYGEGYTIKGVQRILKSQGSRFVQNVWRDPASLAAAAAGMAAAGIGEAPDEDEAPEVGLPSAEGDDTDAMDPPMREPAPGELPLDFAPSVAPLPAPAPAPASAPAMARTVAAERHPGLVLRAPDDEAAVPGGALSRDEVRRLKIALYELIEARRLLDDAR